MSSGLPIRFATAAAGLRQNPSQNGNARPTRQTPAIPEKCRPCEPEQPTTLSERWSPSRTFTSSPTRATGFNPGAQAPGSSPPNPVQAQWGDTTAAGTSITARPFRQAAPGSTSATISQRSGGRGWSRFRRNPGRVPGRLSSGKHSRTIVRVVTAGELTSIDEPVSATLLTPFTPHVVQGRATHSGCATRPPESAGRWQASTIMRIIKRSNQAQAA